MSLHHSNLSLKVTWLREPFVLGSFRRQKGECLEQELCVAFRISGTVALWVQYEAMAVYPTCNLRKGTRV